MSKSLQFEYTTVGHVTIDVLPDGSSRAGGTALYSALQASRLGLRTLIRTRGVPAEIEAALSPYRHEFELEIEPANATTRLATTGRGPERRQRMLAWAGPIEAQGPFESSILHLAPVARELPHRCQARAGFLGLTPQGLVRDWRELGAEVSSCPPDPLAVELAGRCDATVISEQERASCAPLIATATRSGGLVAVTAGPGPTRLLLAGGTEQELAVSALERPADDIGAGDVYASAFFIELSRGSTPADAATFAAAAAAERMRGAGPQAIAGRALIESRLNAR